MLRTVSAALLLGLILGEPLALSACSGSALTDSCGVAGRQRSCPCSGSAVGIQACQLDGAWETCTCYGVNGPIGGSSSGSGGASGAGGTSTRSAAVEADRGGAGGANARGGAGGSSVRPPFPFGGRPARRD
ncbi:MAG TPA: hypothetical protein VFN67_00440 [Polyangiales bacterium]|nr:hypothetical protein [Polyangiales bacterium]